MKNLICILHICFVIFLSCTQEVPVSDIDFANVDLKKEIAVDGFVCNEKERCMITLRKPVPISEYMEIIPINDADVFLKHNKDTYYFELDTNGVYYSIDSIAGISGDTYTLEIRYNGKIYTAEEIMPYEPNDEFDLPFTYMPPNEGVFVRTHNFGYNKTNIWIFLEMRENFPLSLLFRSPFIYTHKGSIPQGIFPPINEFTGPSGMTTATDSIEIFKAEISEHYNQYLLDKFNETMWQGQMFSTIPGNLETNLSKGAVGYFYALNVKRKRFMIKDLVDLE